MRLFAAIELAAELRRPLLELIRRRRGESRDVRWVSEHQLHLTLKFLGDVDESRLDAVQAVMQGASAAAPRFSLALASVGGFPNPRSPRVFWVGVGDPLQACRGWVVRSDPRFAELGVEAERRPYSPHITLARSKTAAGDAYLARILQDPPAIEALTMEVREVVLFQSELLPDGAKHTPLFRAPLAGESAG